MRGDIRLDGQVAVVTGAGRGIGRATALLLAQAGAAVVASSRTASEIEETARMIRENGGRSLAITTDVSRWPDVDRLASRTRRLLGPADLVVVNAAMVEPLGPFWELDPREWAENIAVNLTGAYYTARAFLPEMRQRRRGVLVFVSTGLAVDPLPGFSAYAASKAGLEQMVRTLALEVEHDGLPVRVHGVYPGIVDTPMQEQLRTRDPGRFPEAGRFQEFHTRGWLRAPDEPAALIWWLATPAAADLHGSMVNLNDPATTRRLRADLGLRLPGNRG